MKAIVKANLSFLLPYAVFLLLGALLMLITKKADTHILFNTYHHPFFDRFFAYMTYMGEGVIVTLIFIILLAIKYRYALILAGANIISALITQTLKHTVFDEVVRPKKFFEGVHDLYLVSGIDNHEYFSFPSGHTTSAFSLYFALALIVEKGSYKLLFFIIALLIGYSRIYLSQHFFEDVYAGSIVGVVTAFIVFYFVQKNNRPGLDKSLVTLFN